MPSTLTIFIDGLPFDQLHKMSYTESLGSKARLIPILGYSVNCQTQLFTGKTPDEIGFWCEFTYDPDGSPFRPLRKLLPLLAMSEVSYSTKRVMHKVLDRARLVSCTKNIPIARLADFVETGHSVFDHGFSEPSLLDHPRLTKFLHSDHPHTPDRDQKIVDAALEHIEKSDDPGHVLVTMMEIDHCSHWEGVASPPYDAILAENDRQIRSLAEAFRAKVPDGVVLVVSDHGMANIEHEVDLQLERRFGAPGPSTYSYFVEGTILRIWSRDEALLERMRAQLDEVVGIERYSDEERERDGLTRAEFGQLIYHSLEGYQFVPSYWGPKPSVGMHGHHPRFPSQHGICVSSAEDDFAGEIRAVDFYRVLSRHMDA